MTDKYIKDLTKLAKEYNCSSLAAPILNNPNFSIWSASCHKLAHHYGHGGLLKHTWEVVNLCLQTAHMYEYEINKTELFLSALYHDYGKIWDYDYSLIDDEWSGNNHRRTIHHIQRSAIEWAIISREQTCDEVIMNRVTHNILSHHGRREYGSSVTPLSREAWILHLNDSISARVNDCDRVDLNNVPKQ